jgi:hypothetical protein
MSVRSRLDFQLRSGQSLTSLTRLHQGGRHDLWLPAVPTHGQNANLYDPDWNREIEENLLLLRSILSGAPRR